MSEKDPRFEQMKVGDDGNALVPDRWKIDYWTSMGELSRFFIELKDNGRLMGTKCPQCGSVFCWPRSWCHDCYTDCDWLEMSGKGNITLFTRVLISLNDLQTEVPFMQGGVLLEGARYPLVAFFKKVEFDDLYKGMPVRVEFCPPEERTGRIRDFYFVPDA